MTANELNCGYFDWMYNLVCEGDISYRKLFKMLHYVDFTYMIDMDGNRFDDGIDLRYRFGNEQGYSERAVARYLDDRSCPIPKLEIVRKNGFGL